MNKTLDRFKKLSQIEYLSNLINKSSYDISICDTTPNINCLIASFVSKQDENIVYVASNIYKATRAYEKIAKVLGEDNVNLYLQTELVATEIDATSNEFTYERLNTISSLLTKKHNVIVTHISAITKKLLPFNIFKQNVININKNDDIDIDKLTRSLIELGYKKEPTCSSVGCFSLRGGVIDIFPLGYPNPFRIELFDIEIEKIREYNTETQRGVMGSDIKRFNILPNTELIYNSKTVCEKITNCLGRTTTYNLNADLRALENHDKAERLSKYINYMANGYETLLNYMDKKVVLFDNLDEIKESYQKIINELNYYLENNSDEAIRLLDLCFYESLDLATKSSKKIYLYPFYKAEAIDMCGKEVNNYQTNIPLLVTEIQNSNKLIYITSSSDEHYALIKDMLNRHNLLPRLMDKIKVLVDDKSISYDTDTVMVIDETQIYKKLNLKRSKYRNIYENTVSIKSVDDLKPGDYIVHYDYGIGKYLGIKVIKTGDITSDYLSVKFKNMDLYVPIDRISLLDKYQANEGSEVSLSDVGSGEWERKKRKVETRLRDIARELVLLQAYRDSKKGYIYSKDNEIQMSFEDDFPYQETKDQLSTIQEIKKDMEDGKIIERLVCGDVGYGKTEIAMRIALKTVLNGKQAAYLAPTTLLTRQHYHTFMDRMEKYGVNVALINRMVSYKERKDVISKLAMGEIDIIIGTHALLNDKIHYKDLGLLIIDEEQRFGVTHKEKIKQYKNNVNCLMLSATPIPRTLQMSLIGAKQMSLIETPPQNRYPIQTYVIEQNSAIIREAIYNELGRSGQVFYLFNKIDGIEEKGAAIHKLVPEAKIVIAHGRMDKGELEDAIKRFIDKEFDILLCTTIIETGIDIPNTNTLIVENANRLGLSQMYQIRGRVGRTNRLSYAYFMYSRSEVLTENGRKRLDAIKEFTSFGSGYKIAIRDLAIRGAGDFLGQKQSGYINDVGMDLYIKMLHESILEVQGKKIEHNQKKIDTIEVSKHVDDKYVKDEEIKIYIHKKISKIKCKADRDDVINELRDRFGQFDNDIMLYINKQYLDSLLEKHHIESLSENELRVKLVFSAAETEKIKADYLMKTIYKMGQDFTLEYKTRKYVIYIIKLLDGEEWVNKVIYFLETFYKSLK
ncbi:MAG: transcription-repair coupling factor [Bacilli bacterium]